MRRLHAADRRPACTLLHHLRGNVRRRHGRARIEGLENDAVMAALRRAFSQEHGLQCGFCTPGMLVTARDIVLRLASTRPLNGVRLELSGNLCRCTGYVGIVRAIMRVLEERRAGKARLARWSQVPAGPVGARPGARTPGNTCGSQRGGQRRAGHLGRGRWARSVSPAASRTSKSANASPCTPGRRSLGVLRRPGTGRAMPAGRQHDRPMRRRDSTAQMAVKLGPDHRELFRTARMSRATKGHAPADRRFG